MLVLSSPINCFLWALAIVGNHGSKLCEDCPHETTSAGRPGGTDKRPKRK